MLHDCCPPTVCIGICDGQSSLEYITAWLNQHEQMILLSARVPFFLCFALGMAQQPLSLSAGCLYHWSGFHLLDFGGVFCDGAVARKLARVANIQDGFPGSFLG